jgi:hypothetical protein
VLGGSAEASLAAFLRFVLSEACLGKSASPAGKPPSNGDQRSSRPHRRSARQRQPHASRGDSRSGPGLAFSPLTRVVGLRPGRPTMGTLKAYLCCADALSGSRALTGHARPSISVTGAGSRSGALTGARFFSGANLRWFPCWAGAEAQPAPRTRRTLVSHWKEVRPVSAPERNHRRLAGRGSGVPGQRPERNPAPVSAREA